MKNVTQLLATLCLLIAGFVPAFGQNEIAQATTRNEKVIVDDGWAYFVTPKRLFTEKGTIDKVWITDIAPPISTYTEEEKKMQLAVNQEFGKEFVMTYDHIPDSLEYTNDNFRKPVAERDIDNEEITPYTWKWVHLEMPEAGGGMLTANLRRPNWWLIDNKANKEGNWVKIDIEEMNISGLAQVKGVFPSWVDTRITDFKEEGKNKFRPITGWFERTAPEVWNYVFSTGDTIGSTPNHPFFSEDKQEYIAVGDLGIGERVKLAGERTATLVSKWMRENGQEKVYNLEVWRDHNFHVGVEGILVHNSCLIGEIIEETANWFKYKNFKNKILKINKQTPGNIENSIATAENLPDIPANAGRRAEAKVARAVQEKKDVKGYGVKVDRENGTAAGDMDVVTEHELIEVKKSIGAISTDLNQFKKYANFEHDDFMNLNAKKVILYIDDAAANPNHPTLQAIQAMSNTHGIEIKIVIGSLDELKNALQ
jgi:hypothetical protein